MKQLYIHNPKAGYHLSSDGIATTEQKYGAVYMGFWCTKNPGGGWNESPVDVFYQPNPDVSLGHKSYFGILKRSEPITGKDRVYICDATSAFSEPIKGVICGDGEVLVSRYRHDFQTKGNCMIDGGRDYTRSSWPANYATVLIEGDKFIITEDNAP